MSTCHIRYIAHYVTVPVDEAATQNNAIVDRLVLPQFEAEKSDFVFVIMFYWVQPLIQTVVIYALNMEANWGDYYESMLMC